MIPPHVASRIEDLAKATILHDVPMRDAMRELQRLLVSQALNETQGNISRAARLLRCTRVTIGAVKRRGDCSPR